MIYKNLSAELARKGMGKADLVEALNENGVRISYSTLQRQLRGESDIPFGQAMEMAKILEADAEYLLKESS